MKSSINVAIADDNQLFRQAIAKQLAEYNFNVVIDVDNGHELINNLKKTPSIPDVCVLDIKMRSMNGYEAIKTLQKEWPFLKVLVLSLYNDERCIMEMLSLGASGYLCKAETTINELCLAVNSLYYSGYFFSKGINSRTFEKSKSYKKLLSKIPTRELEFLHHCAENLPYEQIAKRMNVSIHTVETYRNNLFAKFKIHSKAELLTIAFRTGLLQV